MARTQYHAAPHGTDQIAVLSFDPDAADEGDVGEDTLVSLYREDGLVDEKPLQDGAFIDLVTAPDGEDLWLLTRFGSLWSFAEGAEIAQLSQAPTDQFIGMDWLGTDLLVFGGNNLLRRVDPTDFSSQQVVGLTPLPLPDAADFQAAANWATQQRETYALMGVSALHFTAARSHGEVATVEDGILSLSTMAGAETTRFADLARSDDGSLWLTGANDAPRVVRWAPGTTPSVIARGSQVDQAPTSVASWKGRVFLGDESYENGGFYDLSPDGIGRRWPGISDVVALVATPARLWIVSAAELRVLADGTLVEIQVGAG